MGREILQKAPFIIYVMFASLALITSFIPYSVGGVVSSFLWFTPFLFLDKCWINNKLKFIFLAIATWILSILIGELISETWMDIRFPL